VVTVWTDVPIRFIFIHPHPGCRSGAVMPFRQSNKPQHPIRSRG
jgi:hypothetical protein